MSANHKTGLLGLLVVMRQLTASPPVKHDTGDHEHSRQRQRLREHFRGSPLAGFLHALSPGFGHDSSLRESACDGQIFTRKHPATSIRFDESPLSEYRPLQDR